MTGTQVIRRYWNDTPLNTEKFQTFAWDDQQRLWFRTGDLCRFDPQLGYLYIGRCDDQWKIRGQFISKNHLESEYQQIFPKAHLAITPYFNADHEIIGIILHIAEPVPEQALTQLQNPESSALKPIQIISYPVLPQTISGKIDYQSLKTSTPGGWLH